VKARRNRTLSESDHPGIWALYADGLTQTEIALRFDCSQQRIAQIIHEYRQTVPQQDREEIIAVMLEQCRVAVAAVMPKVRRGDSVAIRDLLRIQERIARMLGLDQMPKFMVEAANQIRYVIEQEDGGDDIIRALGGEVDPLEVAASQIQMKAIE
jgi:hypothetical protein